jgi:hypothetical protein
MRPSARFTVTAATGMWPAQAFACTLCDSAQAVSVRARLLQPDLWFNLCAVLVPLALFAAVVALVARHPARGDA